jgi:succinoglycan biosynthesis transport protein ExoP
MEEDVKGIGDYLAIIKRRRWQFIVPALLIFVAATLAALLIPPTYRSSATILIEQQEIPQDLVRTTVTSYAAERVQVISYRVLTTAKLGEIIERAPAADPGHGGAGHAGGGHQARHGQRRRG